MAVEHTFPDDVVLIVGGGPVGLILARNLSTHGVRSVVFERNTSTTTSPKMDLTNARSMELFRKIGLSEQLRKHGVEPQIDQDVLISSGLSRDEPLAKWDLPSVNKFRERIKKHNDGTQPQEPWQRISQAIFEKCLKVICDEDTMNQRWAQSVKIQSRLKISPLIGQSVKTPVDSILAQSVKKHVSES
jgi:2-polyprenyl-6-methoxyphenol hydroxylase-like FAD-dependent oxidoreductase